MWASELLTLRRSNLTFPMVTYFTSQPESVRAGRIELVLFNCPEYGVSTDTIEMGVFPGTESVDLSTSTIITPSLTSCDTLVRVCAEFELARIDLAVLVFTGTSSWIHLAEVSFYNDSLACPPEAFVSGSTVGMKDENSDSSFSVSAVAAITVVATALLAVVIFVLVQIIICKCCCSRKRVDRQDKTETIAKNGECGDVDNLLGRPVPGEAQDYEVADKRVNDVAPPPMSYSSKITPADGTRPSSGSREAEGDDGGYEDVGDDRTYNYIDLGEGEGGRSEGEGGGGDKEETMRLQRNKAYMYI